MAIISRIKCRKCGADSNESHSPARPAPSMCRLCQRIEVQQVKDDALAAQAAKSVEDRLREIEEFIYEHRQVQHGYIPEPRF